MQLRAAQSAELCTTLAVQQVQRTELEPCTLQQVQNRPLHHLGLGGPTCVPIYFLFDFKNGDMAAILILFGPISRKLCKIGYWPLFTYRKSHLKFHLAPLALTLSDLERSIQVTGFQWSISPNLFKITTELLLVIDRKSYMKFHLVPLSLTLSDLERSNRGQALCQRVVIWKQD